MMLMNFFLVDKQACTCMYAFHAEPETEIDTESFASFYTSISGLLKVQLDDSASYLCLSKSVIGFVEVGEYVLISRAAVNHSAVLLVQRLREAANLLLLLFGAPSMWDMTVELEGLEDVLERFLRHEVHDLRSLVPGVDYTTLHEASGDRVARALIPTQESSGVEQTALLLGGSVLKSRITESILRTIVELVRVRPLSEKQRTLPVFTGGKWSALHLIQVSSLTLVLIAELEMNPATIADIIANAEREILDVAVHLPLEERPLQLRHFRAGMEVAALVFTNGSSGCVICPQLRPGTKTEQMKVVRAFMWFYHRWKDSENNQLTNAIFSRDDFIFHVQLEGAHCLQVLYYSKAGFSMLEGTTSGIMAECIARAGG